MVDISLHGYLENLQSSKSSEEVWSHFIDQSSRLGIPCVSYGFRKLPQDTGREKVFDLVAAKNVNSLNHTWVTTAPKPCVDYWVARQHLMEKIDPMVTHIQSNLTPLCLGNSFLSKDDTHYKDRKELYDIAEQYGIFTGYGVPIKQYDSTHLGEVVYHTPYKHDEFVDFIQKNGPTLHMLAIYMHMMFQPFERAERAATMGIKGRQLEVLQLMKDGLTNTEISLHLDIAPATVSYHIKDLKERLKANSTRDIIPLALRLNIITA